MQVGYYVYYRVALDQSERARRAVALLQEDVRGRTGVSGRLLHRRDDPATWMEIYEHVHDVHSFDAALDAAVSRHGVGVHIPDGRHVERFIDHP